MADKREKASQHLQKPDVCENPEHLPEVFGLVAAPRRSYSFRNKFASIRQVQRIPSGGPEAEISKSWAKIEETLTQKLQTAQNRVRTPCIWTRIRQ